MYDNDGMEFEEFDGMGEEDDDDSVVVVDEVVQAQPVNQPGATTQNIESAFERKIGVVNDLTTVAMTATTGDVDKILSSLEQFSKSQLTRVLDVTVIGPILLYYAYKGKLSPVERAILGLIGVGTVIYNYRNFVKNKQMISGQTLASLKDVYSQKIQN